MKRIMCFLLIFIVIMSSFLYSCNGTVNDSSMENPSEENSIVNNESNCQSVPEQSEDDSISDIESEEPSVPEQSEDDSISDIESEEPSVPEQSEEVSGKYIEHDKEVSLDRKHWYEYYIINLYIIDQILSREDFSRLIDSMHYTIKGDARYSSWCDYGDICDYYRIPENEFVQVCQKVADEYVAKGGYDKHEIDILRNAAAFFVEFNNTAIYEKYSDVPMQLVHEDQSVFLWDEYEFTGNPTAFARDKNDSDKYTNRYYTIDSALIDFVGVEQFSDYYDKYAYTSDFNIVSFINYFEVSKDDYIKLYYDLYGEHFIDSEGEVWIYRFPYNPDYLYGTEEMQNEYFCRHDRTS